MFTLTPHIELITASGTITFWAVNDVRIEKSIFSFIDTAIIKVPATARLQQDGTIQTESVETARQFQEGDKVTIRLGYDDDLQEEFIGFVKRVNFTTPCEIECEGFSWQLRKKSLARSWKNATIKDILKEIISGTDITLSNDIPDISLNGIFTLNDEDGTQALDRLKKEMFLTVYFIGGNQLYVGLEQTAQLSQEVKYRLGWNTIKDDQLKYRRAEDTKVRMRVNYRNAKGKSVHKIYGKAGGIEKVMECGTITDSDLLKRLVNAKAREFWYAGYEGKITTFIAPFSQHGWKATITDEKYPERNGSYMITSIGFSLAWAVPVGWWV